MIVERTVYHIEQTSLILSKLVFYDIFLKCLISSLLHVVAEKQNGYVVEIVLLMFSCLYPK